MEKLQQLARNSLATISRTVAGDDEAAKKQRRRELPIVAHTWSIPQLASFYNLDLSSGLTSQQVKEQRERFGWNRLTPQATIPWWRRYINQYLNFFSILLMTGGVLCFIAYGLNPEDVSNVYLGAALVALIFITSTFSYYQEAKSNALMEGFKSMVPKRCRVVRDGSATVLDASELVPGDVVELQEGDMTPADLRVVQAYNLKVDNSALTGEPDACERVPDLQAVEPHGAPDLEVGGQQGQQGQDQGAPGPEPGAAGTPAAPGAEGEAPPVTVPAIEASNLLFYSTLIVSGHCRAVVIGIGDNTVMGQIAGLAGESDPEAQAPIQMEVGRFITGISAVAIVVGLVFLGIGIGLEVQSVVQAIVFCIGAIVATVPEGLLATLTVAMALTAKRLHNKNVLVKNMQSVSTLGCTNVIASDKTGTLTQNRMTVQHAWLDDETFDVPASKNLPQHRRAMAEAAKGPQGWRTFLPQSPTFLMLQKVATLCNNSDFVLDSKFDPDLPLLDLAVEMENEDFNLLGLACTGDASESGLIKAMQVLGDVKAMRVRYPKLFEIKFNSTNKWQLSIHDMRADGEDRPPMLLLKGAPERVWSLCSRILVNGEEQALSEELQQRFQTAYEGLGGLGERVLGFAYRSLPGLPHDYPWSETPQRNFPTDNLTFVGLLSLMDPPREGVPEAVAKCKKADIQVFMVTGDHPITAQAIARQVGILDDEVLASGRAVVKTGDDLRAIEDIPSERVRIKAWNDVLSHQQIVFARVTPAHKLLIVENNQRLKRMVAVTGDGVNDAPALKKADIGVAMGIAGKDVSKEAADMILMDDNFASIVNGVEEGRLVFDNLKKSIAYTLSSKLPELTPFLVYVSGGLPLALTTILLLCIDLGTDMVPAISLAYEPRESDIMSKPPRRLGVDKLVDAKLLAWTYLHVGIMQAASGFLAFMMAMNDFGYSPAVLMGRGLAFDTHTLICTVGDSAYGMRVQSCGYGCNAPPQGDFCQDGCEVPAPGSPWDPFVEFTPQGFRGFAAGVEAVCARSCAWWLGLGPDLRQTYLAEAGVEGSQYRYILTPDDDAAFQALCGPASALPSNLTDTFGFAGRDAVAAPRAHAPVGGAYWWAGQQHSMPNYEYQAHVLRYAQTAYFCSVVMHKVVTVMVAKTRKLSFFSQGMLANTFMLWGLLFELCLVALLVYVPPFNTVFGTLPLAAQHILLPGLPFAVLLLGYEELRKGVIRAWPGGWVDRMTYY